MSDDKVDGRDEHKVTGSEKDGLMSADSTSHEDIGVPSKRARFTNQDKSCGKPWMESYRRVIAILPTAKNSSVKALRVGGDNIDSSDDDSDDNSDGDMDTSSSSSGFEENIPFPTKPKVVVKRSETGGQSSQC